MNESEQLLDAIERQDFSTFERLLATCAGIANARINGDATLLMRALSIEDIQPLYIRRLIEGGADVKATTSEGYSVLHHIAFMGYMEDKAHIYTIARLLAEAGADREQRTHWTWTPIMAVAMEGSIDEFKALLSIGCSPYVVYGETSLPLFSRGLTLGQVVISQPMFVRALLDHGYKYDDSINQYASGVIERSHSTTYPGKTPESEASYISDIEESILAIRQQDRQQSPRPYGSPAAGAPYGQA